jgi:tetratricopeptide (TPR) repeat protein
MKIILFFSLTIFSSFLYSQEIKNSNNIRELDSLISIEPNADNYYLRGYFKYNAKDYKSALLDYDQSILLDKDNFKAFFSRGMLKDKLSDFYGAIIDYTKCIALNGESSKAYFNRGFSKSNVSDIKGAIEDYSKCIKLNSEHKAAFLNRGILKKDQNLFEEALSDYDNAIAIDNDFLDAVQSRAILKALMNRKDAIQDFNAAIRIAPDDGESYYNRAVYIINFKIDADYCSDVKKAVRLGFTSANVLLAKKCSTYNAK